MIQLDSNILIIVFLVLLNSFKTEFIKTNTVKENNTKHPNLIFKSIIN